MSLEDLHTIIEEINQGSKWGGDRVRILNTTLFGFGNAFKKIDARVGNLLYAAANIWTSGLTSK